MNFYEFLLKMIIEAFDKFKNLDSYKLIALLMLKLIALVEVFNIYLL
jgi:hypothetical protein